MTVAEIAKQLGKSHQAVYKKIGKAGLQLSDLRDASTGKLTPEGVEVICSLFATGAVEKPSTGAQQVENEVEKLRNEVAKLQQEAAAAAHRAELAEVKAAAAENERDYLRQQLDASIKAAALASVRRLTAPDDERATPAAASLRARIKAAWAALHNK